MPPLDLELADEAIRAASARLGRKLPHTYPADPVGTYRERTGGRERSGRGRGWGTVVLVADAAEDLLGKAAEMEAAGRDAQALLVRALRNLGGASRSWAGIGQLTGMTQQGAHKRFRAAAEAPRPQLTINDAAPATSAL
jgi:hypothetical protein